MGDAIIGLIGVVVGALLSGGFAMLTKRQSDRQDMRALTRIIEDDLAIISSKLQFVKFGTKSSDSLALLALLRASLDPLPLEGWQTGRSKLAALLQKGDWYAVAKAYSSISMLRQITYARDTPRFLTQVPQPFDELVTFLTADVDAGAKAMARVARNDTLAKQSSAFTPDRNVTENLDAAANEGERPSGQ